MCAIKAKEATLGFASAIFATSFPNCQNDNNQSANPEMSIKIPKRKEEQLARTGSGQEEN
jgi:hypothetical protein